MSFFSRRRKKSPSPSKPSATPEPNKGEPQPTLKTTQEIEIRRGPNIITGPMGKATAAEDNKEHPSSFCNDNCPHRNFCAKIRSKSDVALEHDKGERPAKKAYGENQKSPPATNEARRRRKRRFRREQNTV